MTPVAEMNSNMEEPRNQDFLEETLMSNKNVVCRSVSSESDMDIAKMLSYFTCI